MRSDPQTTLNVYDPEQLLKLLVRWNKRRMAQALAAWGTETVLLRLIDSKGAPNVKIAATEDGSAVSLGGESNPANVQVLGARALR